LLSRRVDQLTVLLQPAATLPPCPTIRLDINTANNNTPSERAQINAFFERAALRKERLQFEIALDFSDEANSNDEVPQTG